jgi:hypothetical protein
LANVTTTERPLREDLRSEIEHVGGELRRTLQAVLSAVAGDPPRPTRVARPIGLDKSLASRFVRAIAADSDLELMYIVPSPEGLRILAERAGEHASAEEIRDFLAAAQRFEQLLNRVPGGRAAIDAQISEESSLVRERSEHAARQAAFKSMSFLLGHYCETLSTSLFLVPSKTGRRVDGIEVHRRLGLRRMRPGTPLALLSMHIAPEVESPHDTIVFESIDGPPGTQRPDDYLLREFSSDPLPEMTVHHEGKMSTLVLEGEPNVHAATNLSSAFRVRNAWSLEPDAKVQDLRGYVLHVPTRRLVRDVFVADTLYPGAAPRITFLLPGPRGHTPVPEDEDSRHYANVSLYAPIEALPRGSKAFSLSGSPNHAAAIRHVLERAGHGATAFRGWRCAITYPVPMVEMMWWLVHPSMGKRSR